LAGRGELVVDSSRRRGEGPPLLALIYMSKLQAFTDIVPDLKLQAFRSTRQQGRLHTTETSAVATYGQRKHVGHNYGRWRREKGRCAEREREEHMIGRLKLLKTHKNKTIRSNINNINS